MERGEPALIPEWLKGANGGISSGSGGSSHQFASSSQSDDHVSALPTRSRSSVSSGDHDTPRSFMDRTSSSYFRRSSSSNGSMMHDKDSSLHSRSYSSFSRSHRDKEREKELEFRLGDHGIHDYSDPLTLSANAFTSKIEKDSLRRSQSMISGRRGEVWHRRAGNDTSNGLHIGGGVISNIQKAAFERDFPSLGAEEKPGVSDISRVSSPGLGSASQNLPMGTSSVIGGECWTSALAEIPVIVGSNSTVLPSIQQTVPANSGSVLPSMTTGLNMAETLAQAPSRARTAPQLSVENQRLEEFAIKKSRQLIPMTPSMPKSSVLSSEKAKPKTARAGESSALTKLGQQPSSSLLVNHATRGPARSDASKTPHVGKLHVLKSARENNGSSSPTAKDVPSPTTARRVSHGVAASAALAPLRSPNNPKIAVDRKATALPVAQSSSLDRRHPSRNDFFNSLRRKNSVNHSAPISDSSPAMLSSVSEKPDEQIMAVSAAVNKGNDEPPTTDPGLGWPTENGSDSAGNNDACEEPERCPADGDKIGAGSNPVVDPDIDLDAVVDPHEVAFLRSLGWEENAGVEALTEEEISAFYECLRLRQANVTPVPPERHVGNLGGASSGPSSSDSESEA
ncbi:uncharacterized protein LOC131242530 [Magnolia sinica]|uniref:uncharacterized protein LOC131242530 n=1 Tax=Magnolia sinica TaxID=86752 RepID=UPI0026591D58|nr:uncharacterized protein LOC131242530 [Magnolia sinica]